jgi:hypothetical protein
MKSRARVHIRWHNGHVPVHVYVLPCLVHVRLRVLAALTSTVLYRPLANPPLWAAYPAAHDTWQTLPVQSSSKHLL